MEPDELEAAVTALQTAQDKQQQDQDRLERDLKQLRREYDLLANKLRYPGTKFLVELEYKLVYEVTTSVAAGTVTVMPAVADPPFETLPGKLHAIYALSAYLPDDTTDIVIMDGAIIAAPATTVTVAIQRQQKASPTRIEARVVLDNTAGGAVNVAVRVWRRLGMGS